MNIRKTAPCPRCKGQMQLQSISKTFRTKSRKYINVMAIPVYICPCCGELVYTKEAEKALYKLLANEE